MSIIVAVALVILPDTIPGASEDGTVKLIINVSSPSTMLSFVTGIFTVLLLVPAMIVTVCVVELKSVLFPEKRIYTDQNSQPHSEVALKTTLNKDLYLILGSLDLESGIATLKIRINNLVSWVWIGTLLLIIGTVVAIIPSKKVNE